MGYLYKTVVVLVLIGIICAKKRYDGYQVISVQATTEEQAKALRNLEKLPEVSFWKEPGTHIPTDIQIPPNLIDRVTEIVKSLGLAPKITVDNVQSLIDDEENANKYARDNVSSFRSSWMTPSQRVRSYFLKFDEINKWMDSMATEYSSFVKVWTFGYTHEGKPTKVMRIGSGDKQGIFIDAGLHAREWIAVSTALYIIDELLTGYKAGTSSSLINRYDWYFVPVANPDGYDFTHNNNRMWRKNTRPMHRWCSGADPNRNFDINFGGSGTSSNPCEETYHGPSAFSEPCSRNLKVLIEQLSGKLKAYISLHAYSQMWFVPYAYSRSAIPGDIEELTRVAKVGTSAIYRTHRRSYIVGSPANLMYEAAGSSMDWVKANTQIKYSFALEMRPDRHSRNGFIVPPSEIIPAGEEMFAGLNAISYTMK